MIYLVFTYGSPTSKHKIENKFVHRYFFTAAVRVFMLFYVNKVHL